MMVTKLGQSKNSKREVAKFLKKISNLTLNISVKPEVTLTKVTSYVVPYPKDTIFAIWKKKNKNGGHTLSDLIRVTLIKTPEVWPWLQIFWPYDIEGPKLSRYPIFENFLLIGCGDMRILRKKFFSLFQGHLKVKFKFNVIFVILSFSR